MKDLGVLYASQIGVAPGEDPHVTQFAVFSEDARVGFFLPTLEIPGTFMAILGSAAEASKHLPVADVLEAQALNMQRQLQQTVEVIGIRCTVDGDMLLLNVGVGMLAFKLSDAAKDELAQICREIG